MPQRFMSIREIRFTVALREAITIAATSAPGSAQFHAPRRRDNHRRFQKGRFSAQHCCRRAHRAGQLADRSRENIPGLNGRGGCEQQCDWEMKKPGTSPAAGGTRASANTSGPDLDQALGPVKLRSHWIRNERRKLVSSAGPVFERVENSIQPFDLMSRRHPLSSTGAVRSNRVKQIAEAQVTCRQR